MKSLLTGKNQTLHTKNVNMMWQTDCKVPLTPALFSPSGV